MSGMTARCQGAGWGRPASPRRRGFPQGRRSFGPWVTFLLNLLRVYGTSNTRETPS